jgi:hypothetical protein
VEIARRWRDVLDPDRRHEEMTGARAEAIEAVFEAFERVADAVGG